MDTKNSHLDLKNSILVRCECPGSNAYEFLDIRKCSWVFNHFKENPPKILRVFVRPDMCSKAYDLLGKLKGGA